MRRVASLFVLSLGLLWSSAPPLPAQATDPRVLVITIDGYRWQEFFGGADPAYFRKDSKGRVEAAAADYAGASADERRARVMPFVWRTVARDGQIFGEAVRRSRVHLTNGLWFSYPGYNELLTGAADPRVDSNDTVPNPNVTVLEWLHGRPGFAGRVEAFGAWDVLPFIVNTARSGIPVGTAFTPAPRASTLRERELNQMARDLPAVWSYGTFDAPFVEAALEAMRVRDPRVVYLMLGEGDEWAHEGQYRLYLDAARRADRFIERLWTAAQALPAYRGKTTLLVTTDHGRGDTPAHWTDHGRDVPAAEDTWMFVMGPGIPALGVRGEVTVTTAQFAATIARAAGQDFAAAVPKAAPPVPVSR